jgi:protein-tyrosine phosphatase
MTTRRRVLFVCTGNIFRSLTAEHALRRALERTSLAIDVASAGTEDFPYRVRPVVRDYLLERGIDVSSHVRRTLTRPMLDVPGWVIAMSTEHREVLHDAFGLAHVPLFTEACGIDAEPLPDVDQVVPDFESNPDATAAHVRTTIDRILDLTPRLVGRLEIALRGPG